MVWAVSLSTMKLISHSLTPKQHLDGIQSLRGFGNPVRPLAQSVLYLRQTLLEASPKAISGRTSYIRVRLEFLRYPQLIPNLFNGYGFGPPRDFTLASTCPWIGHPVSGLLHATCRPIKTRFPFGSVPYEYLTSPHTITRRTVLQKVRCRALTLSNCL
ncbi:hypothetical protein CTHBC1_2972 [Acetivibrio thermocellus BC1]|jgi:hypothetical protein|nr:hypothetical protein CTHBC1_2972 [Acetivibrio thermocellus BC1]